MPCQTSSLSNIRQGLGFFHPASCHDRQATRDWIKTTGGPDLHFPTQPDPAALSFSHCLPVCFFSAAQAFLKSEAVAAALNQTASVLAALTVRARC